MKSNKSIFTISLIVFIVLSPLLLTSQTWETDRARLQDDGSLTYAEDEGHNRIPDFSHAGYRGGGVAIPEVAVRTSISPVADDNTDHIQAAINFVSAMEPDADGFRGAVLLEAGRYPVSGQVLLHTSGVVLRGMGDGRDARDTTIIYGTGDVPHQRDLIVIGGGEETRWRGEVAGSRQDITSDFVQVGSRIFTIANGSGYEVGDNIIIVHPCSAEWLAAIDGGGTAGDADWSVDQFPILYNRYITNISDDEITIDAPVYNHLDRSLAQSYIYQYDRAGLVTNVGIENLNVQIESLGGTDENHAWNAIQFTQVEDAWVRNSTVSGFGLSGVRTGTASRISVINVHSIDPVAELTGTRMYNFNSYRNSNGILFDNCYARNGRHHYISNGTSTSSGVVVLRSISENPASTSEGHRQWSTGILFDNLIDIGTFPSNVRTLGFNNRGDFGTGHGWAAAHSVMWNCEADRPGADAAIIIEQPPTAQNYAIGCDGNFSIDGPFNQPVGYIEGANNADQLIPVSLYEAQLLHRTNTVLSDFEASATTAALDEQVIFTPQVQGAVTGYVWDFGQDATPQTITGVGPHRVSYSTPGAKTVSLTTSNGSSAHMETKTAYINVVENDLFARDDQESLLQNDSITVSILDNDSNPEQLDNHSYVLDGVDDNIVFQSGVIQDQYPFTMMAWINTSSDANQTFMYIGNANSNVTGNTLNVRDGRAVLEAGVFTSRTMREAITDDNIINDGAWHHVAGVFTSPTERHLYVDGMLSGSDDRGIDNVSARLWRLSVGNRQDSRADDDWYEGEIDEVRMYSSALSDTDIRNIMFGRDCSDNEKLLYWNFDDQPTEVVSDQFNFFDGTISGGSSADNELILSPLQAEITTQAANGTAVLDDEFIISYTPEANYTGLDSLVYQLTFGECDSTQAVVRFQVDQTTATDDITNDARFIYPNPTSGPISLTIDDIERIEIHTIKGQLIGSISPRGDIDLSYLEVGAYILTAHTVDGKIITEKIIKL